VPVEGGKPFEQSPRSEIEQVEQFNSKPRFAFDPEAVGTQDVPQRAVVELHEGGENLAPPAGKELNRYGQDVEVAVVLAGRHHQQPGLPHARRPHHRSVRRAPDNHRDPAVARVADLLAVGLRLDGDDLVSRLLQRLGQDGTDGAEAGHDDVVAPRQPQPHQPRVLTGQGEEALQHRVAGQDRPQRARDLELPVVPIEGQQERAGNELRHAAVNRFRPRIAQLAVADKAADENGPPRREQDERPHSPPHRTQPGSPVPSPAAAQRAAPTRGGGVWTSRAALPHNR
jgi:hypothetical protein